MSYGTYASQDVRRYRDVRASRAMTGWFAPGACVVATAVLIGAFVLHDRPSAPLKIATLEITATKTTATKTTATKITTNRAAAPPLVATALPRPAKSPGNRYVELLDPAFSLGAAPVHFVSGAPVAATFAFAESAASRPALATADAVPPADPITVAEAEPDLPLPAVPEVGLDIPLPIPRPPVLRLPPVVAVPRTAGRRYTVARAATAAAPDQRSFFEKLFGAPPTPGPMLAYAAPEDGLFKSSPGRAIPIGQATAIYDISAHTVYLPSGARLEAHSGLREKIDDPRFVSERMRGATPPAIYELTLREALFHGVRALRLTPIGGGTTYGRSGLLAHTFMLGPSGQSNGCVSFRNYNAFLQAYERGEIRRLVVVTHL